MKRILATGLAILLLTQLLSLSTAAQVPDKRREFIYGVQAYNGLQYHATYYPLNLDTIYFMADVVNIISPRESLVYFWPITNEQLVDWDSLNETVDGTLEIVQRGQVIQTISQTEYVIQYPNGYDSGQVKVHLGEEAHAQYAEFDRQRAAFRDEVAAYYEASVNYRQDLQEQVESGALTEENLELPAQPPAFLFFSTGVFEGIPLKLPAGSYQIRLRDGNGQIIPGSERNLVTFTPDRVGVSYTIIPHEKWTTPEQSDDPSQVLYARSGTMMYLQPVREYEYNQLYFTRLEQPQNTTSSKDRWDWIPHLPINDGTLEILSGGQVIERVERRPYVVRQYTGSALGYEIIDQLTATEERFRERSPDFEGYALTVAPGQSSVSIRLVDSNGQVVPGSEREIKLVNTANARSGYLLPILPLAVGLGVLLWRRSKLASLPKYGEFAGG